MKKKSLRPQIEPVDLVFQAQIGDEEAFRELYFRHATYVARMVYSIIGTDTDLEDLVQETFFWAYKGLPSLREVEKFPSWLGKIAVRTIFSHLKKRRKLITVSHEMDAFSASGEQSDELRYQLYCALDTLPPKLRVPWLLHRHEQMSLREVAELCDVSMATVKRQIAKAEKHLQKRLR